MTAGARKHQARRQALTAGVFSEVLHPRGKDGKWIEKLGMIELSGLGDKKLDGHRGKVIDIVPSSKRRGEPDIKVEMVGGPGDGKKVTVKPNNVTQAPDKARFDPSIGRDKSDQSIIEGLRERVKNWRDLADAERAANTEVTVRPVAPDLQDAADQQLIDDLRARVYGIEEAMRRRHAMAAA